MYISFGPGFYTRDSYGAPPRGLLNLFAEAAPNQPDRGYTLIPTPGLVEYFELSPDDANIRGVFYQQGVFGDDLFVVYNNTFARINPAGSLTVINTSIAGAEPVSLAFSILNHLVLIAGGEVYTYDGTTLSNPTVDAAINFVSVDFIDARFVIVGDNSSQFYWSDPLSLTFDSLSFATAEAKGGGNLVSVVSQKNAIFLFRNALIEVWVSTGDADAPFQRQPGVLIEKGCIGPRAVALVDQVITFVGADKVVYRLQGYQAAPISTPAIAENIASDDVRASFYVEDNHQFFCISMPEACFCYDTTIGEWAERSTLNADTYRAFQYVTRAGVIFAASRIDGAIYRLDKNARLDGGLSIVREASTLVPLQSRVSCDNVIIDGARGTGLPTGQGEDPEMLLYWSDDGGRNYRAPRPIPLGKQGQFQTRMYTTRLGMMRPPGRVFKVRFTDPNLYRLDGLRINEATF